MKDKLTIAMKKAVEVGIFPKYADSETYLENWRRMRAVLDAVLPQEDIDEIERVHGMR
jgi:hypothetical protein